MILSVGQTNGAKAEWLLSGNCSFRLRHQQVKVTVYLDGIICGELADLWQFLTGVKVVTQTFIEVFFMIHLERWFKKKPPK